MYYFNILKKEVVDNMKKLIASISILCLAVLFLLTGCGNNDDKLPKIVGDLDITPFKTAITVKTNFEDTDVHDLYVGNVKLTVVVTTQEDDNVKEVGRKNLSIKKTSVTPYVEKTNSTQVKDEVAGQGQFLVSFETNGGSKVGAQAVTSGKTAKVPSIPIKAGFKFHNWYTDEECNNAYNFSTPVTSSFTLYAKWIEVAEHTINFETNGGSAIESRVVNDGTRVSRPTDPTKQFHIFGGWYIDAELKTAFEFNTNITSDTTLYAKWTEYDKKVSGENVEFSSLTAGTKYTVKLLMSSGGNQATLDTKEVETLDKGETSDDPIVITNLEQLQGMNKTTDAYYELGADIDLEGEEMPSIFSSSTAFSGHFDGKGHTIKNFSLYRSNSYIGLFAYMSGAKIENLNIENVIYDYSRSDTYLGVLAGYAKNCTISNVNIKNVSIAHSGSGSRTSYVGGFIGLAENCEISECNVSDLTLNIKRAQLKLYVGGFIGTNKECAIEKCSVTNSMLSATIYYSSYEDGRIYLGGFVGVNDTLMNGIEDCYAGVSVSVSEDKNSTSSTGYKTFSIYCGGFAGGNIEASSRFKNCAMKGKINVEAQYAYHVYVGGFVGNLSNLNASKLTNCLYYPTDSGITLKLMPPKTSTKEEDKNKIEQTAYLSMTVGSFGSSSSFNNVVAYGASPVYTITNQHENTTITTRENEQSEDLSLFSDFIKNSLN